MSIQKNLRKAGPEFLLNLKKQNQEVFWVEDYLFAFDEEYVNEIYVKQYNNFTKAGGWHKVKAGIGEGLLTSEEPRHLAHRRILNPAFHVKKINKHIESMSTIISKELSMLNDQESFNISDYFLNLSYNVLTNTLFNDKDLSDSKEFKDIFYAIMKQTVDDNDPYKEELSYHKSRLHNLISSVIIKRINENKSHDDFLDLLIESFSDGGMSLEEVVDEILSMLLAGHETTANVVSWAICHVSLNKEIKNGIKEEANIFFDNKKENTVIDSLKELYLSENVIKETLRLYPPVWSSPREAINDCYIKDTFVPKGTKIILSSYVCHRNEKYFKDSESFVPNRWNNNFEDTLPVGVYFPFHLGPRKCIGYRFGELQAKITLLEFFKNFDVELFNGMPEGLPYATYRPSDKFRLTIKRINW